MSSQNSSIEIIFVYFSYKMNFVLMNLIFVIVSKFSAQTFDLFHIAELLYGWILSDLQQRIATSNVFSSTVHLPGIVRFFTLSISSKCFIVRLASILR